MKQTYRNIQGRRAGKATRDLHYTQRAFKDRPHTFGLTNSERDLWRKVNKEVSRQRTENKTRQVRGLMRLLIMLRRLFGVK